MRTGGGRSLRPPATDPGRCYVKSLKINGRDSSKNYLTHGTLTAGGKLEFGMSDRPDLSRGTAPSDAPYSFSSEF